MQGTPAHLWLVVSILPIIFQKYKLNSLYEHLAASASHHQDRYNT